MTRASLCLCFVWMACANPSATHRDPPTSGIAAREARAKLAKLSPNRVQLWVVAHVRAQKYALPDGKVDEARLLAGTLADADAAVRGGADMLILINSRCDLPLYERLLRAVRERHPKVPLGISALAYGPSNLTEGFRLAREFDAQMVWCEVVPGERIEYEDDDGSYKPADVISRELAFKTQQAFKPDALHTAGVHMKYTRPVEGRSFEEDLRIALGSVDGINITGPKTGELADLQRIRTARKVAGEFPLGLASGVSLENVEDVLPYVDYVIVGTSLKRSEDPLRVDEARVRALRDRMTALGYGPPRG